MKDWINDWKIVLLACATLGLAPIMPEPHIWGKLKWIAGGAKGMALTDYLDLLMHGLPWILLIRLAVVKVVHILGRNSPKNRSNA